MDSAPFPQWPVPLRKGEHFASCDCGFTTDYKLPPRNCYANIKQVISGLLENEQDRDRFRKNSISYFDNYATPQKVAEYVIDVVMSRIAN